MIRIRYKERLSDKEFRENRRILLAEVAASTGIHRVTLSKIANERGYNAGLDSINRLCRFFSCQPGDLLEYVEVEDEAAGRPRIQNKRAGQSEKRTADRSGSVTRASRTRHGPRKPGRR